MSLDWNAERCERLPWEHNEEGQRVVPADLREKMHTAVWRMYAVDMRCITEENAGEFYARSTLAQRFNGGVELTREDVHMFVGLATNVRPVTRFQWVKTDVGGWLDDLVRSYDQQVARTEAKEKAGA